MEKRYYTVATLEAELQEFEQRFGLPSAAVRAAYEAEVLPDGMTEHDRLVWADLFREFCRMRGATGPAVLQPTGAQTRVPSAGSSPRCPYGC